MAENEADQTIVEREQLYLEARDLLVEAITSIKKEGGIGGDAWEKAKVVINEIKDGFHHFVSNGDGQPKTETED
jgi:hypothetical protein